MTDINLAQTIVADCLKATNSIGGQTITNICSGSSSTVPWGSLDWLGFIFICVLIGLPALCFFLWCVIACVEGIKDARSN